MQMCDKYLNIYVAWSIQCNNGVIFAVIYFAIRAHS